MKRFRAAASSITLMAVTGMAAPVWAQDASIDDATRVADVVVVAPNYVPEGSLTATKTDAPLIETPQSISVISRDQIDLLGFVDVQQAVRYTAGIVGENYGPDIRYDFLTQRGFTPTQYVDGLLAPVSGSIVNNGIDLYGFESVEVLRGPSGSLYGNSPPGGIYNLTSRRPDAEPGGELQARYGTDDFKQVAGTVTGALADGLSVRLTGLYRDRESQTDFVEGQRLYVAPAASLDLGPDTVLTLLGSYQEDRNKGDTNGFLPVLGVLEDNPVGEVDRGVNLGEPDYNRYDRDQWSLGYAFEHAFSDTLSFVQNLQVSDYLEDMLVIYGSGLLADNRTVTRSNFPYRDEVNQLALDSRFEAELGLGGVDHRVIAGLDYRDYDGRSQFGFSAASNIDLFDPVYGQGGPIVTPALSVSSDQQLKQTGLYIQDQIDLGRLTLTVSARNDWIEQTNRLTDVVTDQDQFSWRVGATYRLDNGFAPYAAYSTSFQPVVGATRTGNTFVPSVGEQVELGVKYDGANLSEDIELFATAAVYALRQTNVVTPDPDDVLFNVQTGEVEVRGVELEAVARIREQWSINASYTYTDAEVSESNGPDLGARRPAQPRHKLTFFTDYTLRSGSLAGLGFGVGGRYLSDSPGSLPGRFNPVVYVSPAVTLWDAAVHYDIADWRFALNGSNILDERYAVRCSGPFSCFFGQGRQLSATVTRTF